MFDPEKMYSLDELLSMSVDDMANTKPIEYAVNGVKSQCSSWANFTEDIVRLLFNNGDFCRSDLPIIANGSKNKELVNKTGEPAPGSTGKFNKVCDGVWVDIKYNALGHIKNVKTLLEKCGCSRKYDIRVSLRKI